MLAKLALANMIVNTIYDAVPKFAKRAIYNEELIYENPNVFAGSGRVRPVWDARKRDGPGGR
jgi:hypothetical protein